MSSFATISVNWKWLWVMLAQMILYFTLITKKRQPPLMYSVLKYLHNKNNQHRCVIYNIIYSCSSHTYAKALASSYLFNYRLIIWFDHDGCRYSNSIKFTLTNDLLSCSVMLLYCNVWIAALCIALVKHFLMTYSLYPSFMLLFLSHCKLMHAISTCADSL